LVSHDLSCSDWPNWCFGKYYA